MLICIILLTCVFFKFALIFSLFFRLYILILTFVQIFLYTVKNWSRSRSKILLIVFLNLIFILVLLIKIVLRFGDRSLLNLIFIKPVFNNQASIVFMFVSLLTKFLFFLSNVIWFKIRNFEILKKLRHVLCKLLHNIWSLTQTTKHLLWLVLYKLRVNLRKICIFNNLGSSCIPLKWFLIYKVPISSRLVIGMNSFLVTNLYEMRVSCNLLLLIGFKRSKSKNLTGVNCVFNLHWPLQNL